MGLFSSSNKKKKKYKCEVTKRNNKMSMYGGTKEVVKKTCGKRHGPKVDKDDLPDRGYHRKQCEKCKEKTRKKGLNSGRIEDGSKGGSGSASRSGDLL
ncbi:hypothetical protein [Haloplanus rubicundus]|uniref:hypothetical protein n=1 Tax=Haloplanus rubicundus TaxID=1547898 RepID=UPI0013005F7C|nr:hypothetical protein [Haloplanus rubicundus]